jgi:murein DD-endopeptidase MepM/ murein hydrolase activator NlpD
MLDRSKKELEFITHTVKKGENIWKIARRYGLKTHSIVSTNYEALSQRDYLASGMELRIPNRNGIMTELKRNQTLWDLMKTYGTDHQDVLNFNGLESASQIGAGEKIFIPEASPVNPYKYQLFQEGASEEFSWPVSPGRRNVSSGFGRRDHPILNRVIPHHGIDIAAKFGTAIFAARAGIVEETGTNGGYGYRVKIRHADNYRTVYAHMRNGFVREGQYVQKGQRIGEIGKSGLATGSNLHFEVRRGDKALDPSKFLP